MYGCVNYLKEKYGNPTVYITENGTQQNSISYSTFHMNTLHTKGNIYRSFFLCYQEWISLET